MVVYCRLSFAISFLMLKMITFTFCKLCVFCVGFVQLIIRYICILIACTRPKKIIELLIQEEFVDADGGGVAIVNTKWLTPRKREVFWPPTKERSQYNKLLLNGEDAIDPDKWNLFSIRKCFYQTDDIVIARAKLKLAEETSDLQTDDANANEIKSQKRKRTKKVYSSSDEERPPRIRKPLRPINRKQADDHQESEQNSQVPYIDNDLFIANLSSCTGGSNSDIGHGLHFSSSQGVSPLHTEVATTPTTTIRDQLLGRNVIRETQAYQEQVLNLLTTVKEQNSQILSILKEKAAAAVSYNLQADFPVTLPVETEDSLSHLDIYLKSVDNLRNFTLFLSRFGGKDTTAKTNRILREVLADSLAVKFNYYGKRSKKPFSDLMLKCAVVDAVKHQSQSTTKEVEDTVKVWLKHAPELLKNPKK